MMRRDLNGAELVTAALTLGIALLTAPAGAAPTHLAADTQAAAKGPYNCVAESEATNYAFDAGTLYTVYRNTDTNGYFPNEPDPNVFYAVVPAFADGFATYFPLEIQTSDTTPYGAGQPQESFTNVTFNPNIQWDVYHQQIWGLASPPWPISADFTDLDGILAIYVNPRAGEACPIAPLTYVNNGGTVPDTDAWIARETQLWSVVVNGKTIRLAGPAHTHQLEGDYKVCERSYNDGKNAVKYP